MRGSTPLGLANPMLRTHFTIIFSVVDVFSSITFVKAFVMPDIRNRFRMQNVGGPRLINLGEKGEEECVRVRHGERMI